jgi:hypothetical protein
MDSNDTFCIVPIAYLSTLDFSTVRQTSPATCRTSVDGTQAVISWDGEPPAGIEWPVFTLDEIRVEMQRSEWTDPEQID